MTDKPVQTPASPQFPIHRSWRIGAVIAMIMVVLAMLGVALSTTNATVAPTYWLSLVPVFAALCVFMAWMRTRHGAPGQPYLVMRQILHWLVIAIAIGLDFTLRRSGEETGIAAGLNALTLLAVGCLLAGVHLEWIFALVGALLIFTLVCVAKAEQYVWLIFVVGGLVLALILVLMRLFREPAPAVTQTPKPGPG